MALRTLYFERLALFSKYTFCFKFGETFIALLILCFKMVIYISQCNCLTKIIKSLKCWIKKKILDVKKSIVVYTVKPWWIIIHYVKLSMLDECIWLFPSLLNWWCIKYLLRLSMCAFKDTKSIHIYQ